MVIATRLIESLKTPHFVRPVEGTLGRHLTDQREVVGSDPSPNMFFFSTKSSFTLAQVTLATRNWPRNVDDHRFDEFIISTSVSYMPAMKLNKIQKLNINFDRYFLCRKTQQFLRLRHISSIRIFAETDRAEKFAKTLKAR